MADLQVRLIRYVDSEEGTQADLLLIEPNGDEHRVRCLCKKDGSTDIGEEGDGQVLAYLNNRYGPVAVCTVSRRATIG